MVVVYPVSHRDYTGCCDLLDWVSELGPYERHKAVLVMSTRIGSEQQAILLEKLRACQFSKMFGAKQKIEEESGWPLSCNRLWQMASEFIESTLPEPWFWNEADAIPLKPGWLDALDNEYRSAARPYMGVIFDWISATAMRRHVTGTCVYPPNVRRFNPASLVATSEPWDCVRPELTIQHTHQTQLICHRWGDRQTNIPHSFPDQASLSIIPDVAAIFHRSKDGTLIQRLREARGVVPSEPVSDRVKRSKPKHISILSSARKKVAALINGATVFNHAGNIGDIVYGLYAIKAFGGGDLIICPEQRGTARCLVPIDESQFNIFKPLLEQQKYLRNVSYSHGYPNKVVHDMNQFRNAWIDHALRVQEGLDTLCRTHFWDIGILDKFRDEEPWLTVNNPICTEKIVIHRSPRYNSKTFPWRRLVQQRQADLLFVGLEQEHKRFEADFGAKVSFWRVKDLLEMARLIAGARCFIGNQSSPLSIAIGLGQKVIVEECEASPDCRFKRDNYTGHLVVGPDKIDFEKV